MRYNPGMDNWPHRTIPRPLQAIGLTAAALCLMGAVKGDDRIHPDPCNHWVAPTAQIKSKANVDEAVKLHPNLALAYLERGNEYLSEAEIEKAKADGRWQKAYDSPGTMSMPEDFLKLLNKNKKAKAFFESLNKTNLYAIAWRLQTAKKPETRERRLKVILEMMAKGKKFH